jgi:hypothetical protein
VIDLAPMKRIEVDPAPELLHDLAAQRHPIRTAA